MREYIKISCFLLTLVFVMGSALQVSAADLNDLINKKDELSDKLDKTESASQQKQSEIKSLSSQIDNLEDEISTTENKIQETGGQISQAEGEIGKLDSEIKTKTVELNELKKKVNTSIVEIYRFSARSSWELIFGGDTLGESSNQAKYVEAIQIQVKSMYNEVFEIKEALDKQKQEQEAKKEELDNLMARQQEYKSGSEYQVSQKDKLKNMNAQQKEEYDALAGKIKSEIAQISSEIYLERQRQAGGGGWELGGGGSGYSPMSGVSWTDAWRFVPYQCTSYAAWYWNVMLGKSWTNTRPGSGSAYNWANLAYDQGYNVSSTPRVGAIISWSQGLYPGDNWGHVAIVEGVNSNGTINLSEYNYVYREAFSRRIGVDPASEGVSYRYIY